MKILIVEDEGDVAEVIRRSLEALGNECLLADSVSEAEALLEQVPVDGLTLDLGLPDAPGFEWLEAMAGNRPELSGRTLVITGQSLDVAQIERLARCGAGLLAKPFTLDHLRDAVRCQLAHDPGDDTPRD